MRSLILIAAVATLVAARPELYKEKEDFQFSRSSSDDGSKSGYYGAQRGNMGGNYEKAHNMDSLAQHQMSGLVQQVQGELGDGAQTRSGSVFTDGNSRGIYGSGRYDYNNLQGRNFQEGVSYGDSQSQSSRRNSDFREHSSGSNSYNSYSHKSRQSNSQQSESDRQELQSSDLQDAYRQQQSLGFSGTGGSMYSYYPQSALINTRPVRIMVRPGTRVSVPVATQTYNAAHQTSDDVSSYDHKSAKSDAEVIVNTNHERDSSNHHQYPNNQQGKHYESSYSYRKEWEKQDSSPAAATLTIPSDNQFHQRSQSHDESQNAHRYSNRGQQYHATETDSHNDQFNSDTKSSVATQTSNSQARYRLNHNSEQESLSSGSNSNAYTSDASQHGRDSDYNTRQQLVNTNSKPLSFQSSYSYHKSWERQGDPYVIVPVPGSGPSGQTSEKLTDSNAQQAYSSHHYGSQHKQSHQSYTNSNGLLDCDCDDEGHVRVARSYNSNDEFEDVGQETQNSWAKIEDMGQEIHNNWDNLELGQQTQDKWGNLENLGQQTSNKWDDLELGQQTQDKWDNPENVGQQTQNKWDNLELGQQTQDKWDNLENLGQQTQNKWDNLEELGQQTQNKWDKIENIQQQNHNTQNVEQETQNKWDKIEDLGQQTQNQWSLDLGQQSQNQWDRLHDVHETQSITAQQQNKWNYLGQADTYNTNSNNFGQDNISEQQSEHNWHFSEQTPQNTASYPQTISDQETVSNTAPFHTNLNTTQDSKSENNDTQNLWKKVHTFETFQNDYNFQKETQNSYDKDLSFDNIHQQNTNRNNVNNNENLNENHFHQVSQQDKYHNEHSQLDINTSNTWNHGTSSLDNFWSKIDSFDLDSPTTFDSDVANSNQFTKSGEDLYQGQNVNKYNDSINDTKTTTMKSNDPQIVSMPRDVGRGDIGPDDSEIISITTTTEKYINNNKYKTPEQIEALSLTKEQNLDAETDYLDKEIASVNKTHKQNNYIPEIIETLPKKNMATIEQTPEEIDQHSIDENNQQDSHISPEIFNQHSQQTIEQNLGLHSHDKNQQNLEQNLENFGQYSQNSDQQKIDQNLEDFGQHSQDFHQQNVEENLEDFGQHSQDFHQQNMEQNLEDFGLHSQDQQNVEQNLEDFGQQRQDIHQQNMEQNLEDFSQHSQDQQNLEQNLEDFGQQSQDLHQQNKEQNLEEFGQHSQNLHQQNMEQNLEDFEQQSQDLHQLNMEHNFEDFRLQTHKLVESESRHQAPQSQNMNMARALDNNEKKSQDTTPQMSPHQIIDEIPSTTSEPVIENTGFWSSIGNKFSHAKNKVKSWFSSS